MKTYDETIDAILAKGDALLEQKKKRSTVIKQTSYAVSGICAAAIVGVGIWRITDHGKMPESGISDIETVEEATTDTAVVTTNTNTVTSSASHNSKATTSASKTTGTVRTTSLSQTYVNSTVSSVKNSEAKGSHGSSVRTTETSSVITSSEIENTNAIHTTISQCINTVTTIKPAGMVTPETSTSGPNTESNALRNLTSIFSTIRLTGTDSTDHNKRDQEFCFDYHNFSEDEIGEMLKEVHLLGNYDGTAVENDARFYEIRGYSADAVAAVKFEGRDDIFLYSNKLYAPETFGEFISALDLDSDDFTIECYHGKAKADHIDTLKVRSLLTADRSLPDVTDSCKGKYFSEQDRVWLEFNRGYIKCRIGIDPQGYIVADTNTAIPDRYFYIGEEKAAEIIGYC